MAAVLVLGNTSKGLLIFRGPLLRAMAERGHRVFAAAPTDGAGPGAKLAEWGVEFHPVAMSRSAVRPLADLRTLSQVGSLCRDLRPDVFFASMAKPVIYGLAGAASAGVHRRFAMIEGLGRSYSGRSPRDRLLAVTLRTLYRGALRLADRVFFLNPDDEAEFRHRRVVAAQARTTVLPGIGVDLEHYGFVPRWPEPPRFLFIGRMVPEKGARLFAEAARRVRTLHPEARFRMIGPIDPVAHQITREEVSAWERDGGVEYGGSVEDVRAEIERSSVLVLPSYYREGLPRSILEAMSMGRAVVTTDSPGCRETVSHGENGLLIEPRALRPLVDAILALVDEPARIRSMGCASRRLAEQRFDGRAVNARLLDLMGL